MEGVEIYDINSNTWSKIHNIKGINAEKVFCRGVGYTLLKGSSILIYGGYDEN